MYQNAESAEICAGFRRQAPIIHHGDQIRELVVDGTKTNGKFAKTM
jgi:hypothetical protein